MGFVSLAPRPSESENNPEYWYRLGYTHGREGRLPLHPDDIPAGIKRADVYRSNYDAGYVDGLAHRRDDAS